MFQKPSMQSATHSMSGLIATNRVLRNTYLLLALTLLCSGLTAGIAMVSNAMPLNLFLVLIGYIGLPMLIQWKRNSPMALVFTFAFTAFVGWTLGPILNFYISAFSNGSELIMMALGGTGLIFLGLTALSINPSRDYSNLGKFITIGAIVAIVAMLINIFFIHLPAFQLAISVIFSLVAGAMIMFQTNMIVRGGETNYVLAAVNIYVSLINIFLTLLQLLGAFGGNRN